MKIIQTFRFISDNSPKFAVIIDFTLKYKDKIDCDLIYSNKKYYFRDYRIKSRSILEFRLKKMLVKMELKGNFQKS